MATATRKRNLSEEPREDGWEDRKDYMVIKRRKLRDQLEELGAQKSDIFNEVTIYVNGYTDPDADELREMIHTNGGHYEYAPSSRVTHVIATNLPAAKIKNLSEASIVCKPQWITDSIKAGLTLPIKNYELYNTSLKGQKEINFKAANKTSLDLSTTTQNVGMSDLPQSKDFVSEFYSHSRLHYLSTWSAELKEFTSKMLPQSKRKIPLVPSGEGLRSKGVRAICHIDVDCFFVSVSIRDTPHLKGKPVAVTHAKKGETQPQSSNLSIDLQQSTSDIASCSYEAREYGIKNGMSVGEAIRRCPNLVLVPYEFEKYRQVSQSLYEVMISYSHLVQAVSCDEAFVELTDYAKDFDHVQEIVKQLRMEVEEKTNCTVSAGISYNMLLARMATRKAKPNGQFYLHEEEVSEYLASQPLSCLPGVGWSLSHQLEELGVTTCGQLLELSLTKLQDNFGTKTGEMLYYFSRGIDHRDLRLKKERKSISVEINYGMRFTLLSEAETLLQQLAKELHDRAEDACVKGTSVCLKMKIRKSIAPMETRKYLGHGSCDNISRSSQLLLPTNSSDEINRICCRLLKQLNPSAADIRGMGIQLTRLVSTVEGSPCKGNSGMSDIRSLMTGQTSELNLKNDSGATVSTTDFKDGGDQCNDGDSLDKSLLLDLPPASQLDQSVLLALPHELQEKVFEGYSKQQQQQQPIELDSQNISPPCSKSIRLVGRNQEEFMCDLRIKIKEWVLQYPTGPISSDSEYFCEFLTKLCSENLEVTDLALKCLRRTVVSTNHPQWIKEFETLLSTAQTLIYKKYKGKLCINSIINTSK